MATKTAEFIWFNGELVPWDKANVHVLTHAMHYGTSVFEGVRCYNTPKGPIIFRHREHAKRLKDSAKIYRFPIPFSVDEIMEATRETVRANKLDSAYIRPLGFVGNVGLGVCPPANTEMELIIAAFPWGSYLGEEALEKGVDAMISSWNRAAPNTIPTAAKAGGNYLSSLLVGGEARRHGYDEGIALSVDGYLSEGAGENIFVIKDGVLTTPPATSAILPGITRDSIMTLARDRGYQVQEANIAREALYLADEVFMTGTAAEVVPVATIDKIEVGSGKRGPITKELQEAYFGLFNGTTEDKWGWLDYVHP
ncbi:branched-chain-amino-acid transaminase [Vibrio sp. OCN044]|uniref:Branched-chain-amino-acid aminotransferase n=1 Tax=Vibrio tetraodonis subsp. pristinus TaxID=2695891 RepID=A0A6L8M1J9_9VIBR|nr:branched-chain-amino-acid transaminase [Vibrio tetraodonis]MYM61336.1 branched-chain-amino-acid transaminase [Vibrio tetraodonis subsp. pristinus]